MIFHAAELFKMVCEPNETDVSIGIPALMLPQDAGATLENFIRNSSGMPLCCDLFFETYLGLATSLIFCVQ